MKKIFISKDIIESEISKNLTLKQSAQNLNTSVDTFKSLCKYHNINWVRKSLKNISRPKIRPDIDKEWLVNNWVNTNKSMHQLAIEENVTEALIDNRRAKYNLVKRFKYIVNKDKLFDLTDPNVYYIAGLIATDGYIPKSSDCFEIALTGESEYELLKDIKEYFESTSDIALYGNSYRLRIVAEGIVKFFL